MIPTTRDLFPCRPAWATFSRDRRHRWTLIRRWTDSRNRFDRDAADLSKMVGFIGLNPSTADEADNDPTVTRCINFAKAWGFDGMAMLNIFAYRATDPKEMKKVADPVGEHNDLTLDLAASFLGLIVCCWGTHGTHRDREEDVKAMLKENEFRVTHLGLTKNGHPRHPLYLSAKTKPQTWEM